MAGDLQAHQTGAGGCARQSRSLVAERTEELRQANESLRKIDETRRGFFADISHELRTPLTVIRGEGEIALRGQNKPVAEYKNSIARIVEQAKHLSVLVNDLLFIARQGAGAARLNLQSIDLGEPAGEGVRRRQSDCPCARTVRDQLQQWRGAAISSMAIRRGSGSYSWSCSTTPCVIRMPKAR